MPEESFQYGDERYAYHVFPCPGITGKIAIHVLPDGIVQVDAPENATPGTIKRAVLKRAQWIKKQVDHARQIRAHALPREYVSGETHFYLGRRYQLKIHNARNSDIGVKLSGGRFIVRSSPESDHSAKDLLESWYRERAREYFARRIAALADRISWLDQPPPFRLLKMTRQWGSCSPKGLISLNPALVKAPRECIEYVIVHELCHLREHNHSPRYYRILSRQMPGWQAIKSRLDGMAELLLSEDRRSNGACE